MLTDLFGSLTDDLPSLASVAVNLPVAAVLGLALAFRPRRHGTPRRDLEVIHTQILLAIVGALVMTVIGESLARAFGIVGAAGLVRYRAVIKDPKDAGVMLCTLGLGLASGVGLHLVAAFATLFLLFVLWLVESHVPKPQIVYRLKVTTATPFDLRPKIEAVLRRRKVPYELHDVAEGELEYEARLPVDEPTGTIERELQALAPPDVASFTWHPKKVA